MLKAISLAGITATILLAFAAYIWPKYQSAAFSAVVLIPVLAVYILYEHLEGEPMKCPNCEQRTGGPDWKVKEHILWANKHGRETRIFCDNCGQWSDIKQLNDQPDQVRVVREPRQDD